jgi:hypothetical protein
MKPRRVTQAVVRRLTLAHPEVIESAHFGRPDFRVANRIFATLPPGRNIVVLGESCPAALLRKAPVRAATCVRVAAHGSSHLP